MSQAYTKNSMHIYLHKKLTSHRVLVIFSKPHFGSVWEKGSAARSVCIFWTVCEITDFCKQKHLFSHRFYETGKYIPKGNKNTDQRCNKNNTHKNSESSLNLQTKWKEIFNEMIITLKVFNQIWTFKYLIMNMFLWDRYKWGCVF